MKRALYAGLCLAVSAILVVGWAMSGGSLSFNNATFNTSGSLNVPTGQTVTINSVDALTRLRHLWLDSGAFVPLTTAGAGTSTSESTTNKITNDQINYDATTQEYAQVRFLLPPEWDYGPVKVKLYWSTAYTAESGVVFDLRGLSASDGATIDTALGESVSVSDTNTGAGKVNITAASTAITLAATPAKHDVLWLEVYRNTVAAGDVIESDVSLLGVQLQYNESQVVSETW